jgi:hypothetical protein
MKQGRPVRRFWDPILGGERKYLRMCAHCSGECKVSIPYDQKEENLKGSVQCERTGFQYTPGLTNSPEKKLDSLGAFAL